MNPSSGINFSPGFKRLLRVIIAINALGGIKRIFESFLPPDIYKKDFIQEYLMAKAILNGDSPYQPLPEMVNRWIGPNNTALLHPTPHPPIVGLLSIPFGYLNYETAAVVWLIFELICLSVSIILLMRWLGATISPRTLILAFGIAFGWMPVIEELWLGQLSLCLLLLLLCAWRALRVGKDVLGGALLGGIIALKLSAWPVVLFLALRRRWRAVMGAAVLAGVANLLSLSVLGVDYLREYYLKIGPLVSGIYQLYEANFSTWTLGQRLFLRFGVGIFIAPLWESPFLAKAFSILAPAAVLIIGLRLANKAENFDTSFGLMIIIGILVNPIAWTHYLLLTAIPLAIVVRRISKHGFPKSRCYEVVGIWLTFHSGPLGWISAYIKVARLFSGQTTIDGVAVVPFAAGILTLIPVIGFAGLLWMLWRSDHTEQEFQTAGADLLEASGRKFASADGV